MTETFPLLHVGGNRALSFLERGERGSLVLRERDFGGRIGSQDPLTNTVPFEKRERQAHSETKSWPSIADVADAKGLQPHAAGQHQPWEEFSGGDAGASRRGKHGIFAGRHVRPPT